MKRTIIFSKNAEQSLANILEYLEFKWSTKVKEQFIKKLDQSVYLIQTNPDTFPKSQINIDVWLQNKRHSITGTTVKKYGFCHYSTPDKTQQKLKK